MIRPLRPHTALMRPRRIAIKEIRRRLGVAIEAGKLREVKACKNALRAFGITGGRDAS